MPKAKPIPSGDGDILRYNAVKVSERKHPAEKPTDLLKRFIQKSSEEEHLILDMFAGCGSTALACKELNRKFIMIEKEKDYFNMISERLKETQGSLKGWFT